MNVAIFTDTFMPKFDGIVTSILNTTGELLNRGNRVMITAPKIRPNQAEIIKEHDPRIEINLIPGINALFYPDFKLTPPMFPFIISKLRKFKAEVVHFHTPFTMGLEAIAAARLLKLPLISTFHTYFIEPEYLKIVKLNWVPGLVEAGWAYSNFCHDRCDVTISPSRFTAEELCRKSLKCPVTVVSNGIALQQARNLSGEEKNEIKKKYGLKENVMLFVGRISEEKCIDVLINSAKRVYSNRDDISLLIVGDGPAFEKYKQVVIDEGLEDSIIFTGSMPHSDLINSGLFECSRFFVTASTSENQPMTIIEACMFGLPIVGVNAKGVPEMILENGFVAEPGNDEELAGYMLKLFNDDSLHADMSGKSKLMGESYDIKKTTDKMFALYEDMIKKYKQKNNK